MRKTLKGISEKKQKSKYPKKIRKSQMEKNLKNKY